MKQITKTELKKCQAGHMVYKELAEDRGIQEGRKFNLHLYNCQICGTTIAIRTNEANVNYKSQVNLLTFVACFMMIIASSSILYSVYALNIAVHSYPAFVK